MCEISMSVIEKSAKCIGLAGGVHLDVSGARDVRLITPQLYWIPQGWPLFSVPARCGAWLCWNALSDQIRQANMAGPPWWIGRGLTLCSELRLCWTYERRLVYPSWTSRTRKLYLKGSKCRLAPHSWILGWTSFWFRLITCWEVLKLWTEIVYNIISTYSVYCHDVLFWFWLMLDHETWLCWLNHASVV